ncbi:transcriptional regulatory protein SrrA [Gottschalkia acidurici 9a]|uniref:Transcriptional regulatory protein SrrA n=1 Tax=Gottschalkia acidurici (strain ATCC 7906 / DSM 604 / BCRC 14475 / CIP 104303 / KCTC 5404 / NCIMB 10678 / 9a) TaxID=1128398 RepID=K0B375_GOTA9|nr:response regulator transcription factor [Gottschalkia acidurici]AFS79335.1 transcriptional regulatory protein SrrA [Gottschalkia acidurici 9a]
MPIKILVADDEERIRKIIGDYLKNDGYDVIEAENGQDALQKFYSNSDLSLIILDIMMPIKDGWEVCKEIRDESSIPIIFLTALGEDYDEIKGLEIGADDYITKPFGYEVFMARVKTILRRINIDCDKIIRLKELEIDSSSRIVKVNNIVVEMSPKEYELLIYLLENKNIALEREKILDAVWGYDFYGDPRTIDTHIKNIRSKIGEVGSCIKTVRGFGYRFEVK